MRKFFNIKITIPLFLISSVYFGCYFVIQEHGTTLSYMIGNSDDTLQSMKQYFNYGVIYRVGVFISFLLIYVFAGIILLRKHGRGSLLQIVFFLIVIFFFVPMFVSKIGDFEPKHVYVVNGYYDRVLDKDNIDTIRNWIMHKEISISPVEVVNEDEWPDTIKELFPASVCIEKIDSINIIRVVHGSGFGGVFGLVVMENPIAVPSYTIDHTEYRKEIAPYAFAWYEID